MAGLPIVFKEHGEVDSVSPPHGDGGFVKGVEGMLNSFSFFNMLRGFFGMERTSRRKFLAGIWEFGVQVWN